jgi:nicotinamide-nucleotide amidase
VSRTPARDGSKPPLVEIVTIGDELLLGYTIDTNGAYLARKLAEIGLRVTRRASVGDTLEQIEAAVRDGLDRSGMVITTGGLGPTADDVSKTAVARLFGRELEIDVAHVEWMRDRWRTRFGREMPDSNMQQAMIPTGATKLQNNHGSAPGIMLEDEAGRCVVMLPGVPREMRGMTDDTVIPLLSRRFPAGAVLQSRTIRTTGVAESLLGDQLRDLALAGDMTLAYLPSPDGTDLRLTIGDASAERAAASLAIASARLRSIVGEAVYGENDDDLAAVVLDRCRKAKHTIAVAESCTGGLLGARLTAIPGSSDVVLGGVIAYHDQVKRALLGVSEEVLRVHGAVSEPVVRQMAAGVQQRLGSTMALAITGIAGPGGGSPEKPVGTVWIAMSAGSDVTARRFNMIGDRDEIRRRSAQAALEMARRRLP